jgi:Glycoside-hydrolase family GH114
MRLAFAWIAVLGLGLGGCDDGKHHLHPEAGMDAPPPPWWRPTLGMAKDWDIQLKAPYDLTMRSTMYDLDLWAVTPATSIDYGDGMPVTVPAGPLAGKIGELHTRGVKVVCHFDTGAIHLTDPDAKKFPGYSATMVPNRPTAPTAGSVIGWSVSETENLEERYLDIREASRPLWTKFMWKRFDLAKTIGCDGVDGDRNDSISDTDYSGFHIGVTEQVSWYRELAVQSHMREISAGMRNGTTLPSLVDTAAPDFDFMFIERCGEYGDCGNTRPFIQLQRVVFAIDYVTSFDGTPNFPAGICQTQQQAQISEGLIKDDAISSAMRMQCTP